MSHPRRHPRPRACAAGSNRPTTRRTDFPIQNLPFGRFRRAGSMRAWRIGVAIGDQVLDLRARRADRHRRHEPADAPAARAARRRCARAISAGPAPTAARSERRLREALVPQARGRDGPALPTSATTPTSTPASITPPRSASCSAPTTRCCRTTSGCRSATTAAPRRSASSGQRFRRPHGPDQGARRRTRRCSARRKRLDYELELGVFIGRGNALGEPIADRRRPRSTCSAWRCSTTGRRATSRPGSTSRSGPFLSKNFASTMSPWIVTMEALAPFRAPFDAARPATRSRCPTSTRPPTASAARSTSSSRSGCRPRRCAQPGHAGDRLTHVELSPTPTGRVAQLVAHHTVNGCNLQPGDLFGTGTLSGPTPEQAGSLLELTQRRQAADHAAQRRDAHLPRGRRHASSCAAAASATGCRAHRLRRVPRHGAAGAPGAVGPRP